jgi:hypothetical protein
MTKKQLVRPCPNCGVRTALNQVAFFEVERGHNPDSDIHWLREWELYQCVSCERPMLLEWAGSSEDPPEGATVLYPADQPDNQALPPRVAAEWDNAESVRRANTTAYAVMVGRMLEVICDEEGATGQTLAQRLTNLGKSGRMPETLSDMATHLRIIRNMGAHASQPGTVTREDGDTIREFSEAIIEYLYRAPAKVDAVKKRLGK